MPEINLDQANVDTNVRKWGSKLLFVQPMTSAPPTTFFGVEDHLPILPADAKIFGFITTDGIDQEDSVSSENTQMDQALEPVRRDLTGIEKTLLTNLGEDNAYVQALWHGVPVEDWPATSVGPWIYHDGAISDYPYMRLGVIAVDGVGDMARYRYEYAYRAAITSKGARKLARNASETYSCTWGLFRDAVAKKSYSRLQDGPFYHQVP